MTVEDVALPRGCENEGESLDILGNTTRSLTHSSRVLPFDGIDPADQACVTNATGASGEVLSGEDRSSSQVVCGQTGVAVRQRVGQEESFPIRKVAHPGDGHGRAIVSLDAELHGTDRPGMAIGAFLGVGDERLDLDPTFPFDPERNTSARLIG